MARKRSDNDDFIRLWNAGHSLQGMAAVFGYAGKQGVHVRARRLGLPLRRCTAEEAAVRDAAICAACVKGASMRALAEAHKLSAARVCQIVTKAGVRPDSAADPAAGAKPKPHSAPEAQPVPPPRKVLSAAPAAIARALQHRDAGALANRKGVA